MSQAPVLAGVLVPDMNAARGDAWPWLAKICARSGGRYEAEDLWAFIEKGALQLWFFIGNEGRRTGVILTETVQYPRALEARIFGAAGERTLWAAGSVIDVLAAWAKSRGCSRLVAAGRVGWARALPGMKLVDVVLERDV